MQKYEIKNPLAEVFFLIDSRGGKKEIHIAPLTTRQLEESRNGIKAVTDGNFNYALCKYVITPAVNNAFCGLNDDDSLNLPGPQPYTPESFYDAMLPVTVINELQRKIYSLCGVEQAEAKSGENPAALISPVSDAASLKTPDGALATSTG